MPTSERVCCGPPYWNSQNPRYGRRGDPQDPRDRIDKSTSIDTETGDTTSDDRATPATRTIRVTGGGPG